MDPDTLGKLRDRVRDVLRAGRPEMAAKAATSPVARYLDPARFADELRFVRTRPQPAGPASEVAAPGDFLSCDVLGVPVLVTRGDDGALRAFLNVCRHRGARVVPKGAGKGKRAFSCPYHAWSYSNEGRLRVVPAEYGFPGLDKSTSGLRPLAVTSRAGILWVVVDPAHASAEIDAALDPLIGELEAMGFSAHVPYAPRELSLACNWKLVLDGSFEAYHFKIAHRATIAHMFADNAQIIDESGQNRRLYLVRSSAEELVKDPGAELRLRQHGNVLYFFFPGTLILVQADHAQVTAIEPTSATTSAIREFALVPEAPASDKARGHWERNVEIYRAALAEDYAMMQSIQTTLASGANEALTFGAFEQAAARFHEQLETAMRA
jgi:phenylpropionate dioxygenase-like ring-hydroxylating dioxygenase large terminal subunit